MAPNSRFGFLCSHCVVQFSPASLRHRAHLLPPEWITGGSSFFLPENPGRATLFQTLFESQMKQGSFRRFYRWHNILSCHAT
jgi:hypothetical protein